MQPQRVFSHDVVEALYVVKSLGCKDTLAATPRWSKRVHDAATGGDATTGAVHDCRRERRLQSGGWRAAAGESRLESQGWRVKARWRVKAGLRAARR